MPPSFKLGDAVAVLERTPKAVAALLDGLPPAWLDAREGPGSWSPREIVAHLIHGEKTDWIPRARILLAHGEARAFSPFDRAGHAGIPGDPAAFAAARDESLRALRAMRVTEEMLDRAGRHPALGRVTLRQLLATWVAHDLGHVRQIARVMAKRYAEDVGPWTAYLPVLREAGGGSGA